MHEQFGLKKIGLFGSYVGGEQREDSDIDLVVEIESSNKFRSFFGLKAYLEDALQKNIDLGIESSLKSIVRKYIKKDRVCLGGTKGFISKISLILRKL